MAETVKRRAYSYIDGRGGFVRSQKISKQRNGFPYQRPSSVLRNTSNPPTNGGWISRLADISSGTKKLLSSFLGKHSTATPSLSQPLEPSETNLSDKQEAVNTVISSHVSFDGPLHGQPSREDSTPVTNQPIPYPPLLQPLEPTETNCSDKQEPANTAISNHFGFDESLHGQPSRNASTLVANYPIPSKVSAVAVAPRRPAPVVSQENAFAAPRSVGRFAKYRIARSPYAKGTFRPAVFQENGVTASRSFGRSAIYYRMARSPYVRAHSTSALKDTSPPPVFQENGVAAPRSFERSAIYYRMARSPCARAHSTSTLKDTYPPPAFQENGVAAPRSFERSAPYHMARNRSPYAIAHSKTTYQGTSNGNDTFDLQSVLSQTSMSSCTPLTNWAQKRRSFDNDIGPVRFVRRVSPKLNLLPGFGGVSSVRGSRLNSSSAPCPPSAEKLQLAGKSSTQCVDDGQQGSVLDTVPSRSRELANRILQQLDMEVTSTEESPGTLSPSMPRTEASRTLEEPTFHMSARENDPESVGSDHSNGEAPASSDGKQKLDTAEKGPPLSCPSLQAENHPESVDADHSNGKAPASLDGKQKLDTAVASTAVEKGPPLLFPSLQVEASLSDPGLSSGSAPYPSSAEKSLLVGKSSTFRFSLAEVCFESDDDDYSNGEPPVPFDGKQELDTSDMTNSTEIGSPVLIDSCSSSLQDKQMDTAIASVTAEEVPAFLFPSLQLIQQAEASLSDPNISAPSEENPQSLNRAVGVTASGGSNMSFGSTSLPSSAEKFVSVGTSRCFQINVEEYRESDDEDDSKGEAPMWVDGEPMLVDTENVTNYSEEIGSPDVASMIAEEDDPPFSFPSLLSIQQGEASLAGRCSIRPMKA